MSVDRFHPSLVRCFSLPLREGSLLWILWKRDLGQRYRGSYLGWGWALLTPLLLLAVYVLIFQTVFSPRWAQREDFALQLFAGLLVVQVFAEVLSRAPRLIIDQAFDCIVARCLAQAQVYVHRDFHSRNLMLLAGARNPGVLDFQDAVIGPITYDLVSLWRDAYIAWDEEVQLDGLIRWWDQARKRGLPVDDAFSDFWTAFEWVGLQRHLKILGIFARLHYRDGKERYLADLPVVLSYTLPVLMRYQELAALADLVIEWLES
ncbi:MAG: hypothetical protein EBX57_08625 [Betaproteobacteria bacterium]|nr:hypothetical protein [Betaproteobacteria bacterium]